ncbi:MAG: NUDIX domain-containing protein [Nanoarchaeota archaeon]
MDGFNIALIGVIFDTKTKKILIGKRENDPYISNLTWYFPGGKLDHNKGIDKTLKEKIKLKTGCEVKNLGTIFIETSPEKKDLILVYFLCEVFKGKEKAGGDMIELKWVKPEDLEKHFTTSFHTRLKEYIMNLK